MRDCINYPAWWKKCPSTGIMGITGYWRISPVADCWPAQWKQGHVDQFILQNMENNLIWSWLESVLFFFSMWCLTLTIKAYSNVDFCFSFSSLYIFASMNIWLFQHLSHIFFHVFPFSPPLLSTSTSCPLRWAHCWDPACHCSTWTLYRMSLHSYASTSGLDTLFTKVREGEARSNSQTAVTSSVRKIHPKQRTWVEP